MSFSISPGFAALTEAAPASMETAEERRRRAYSDYAQDYLAWIRSLSPVQLSHLKSASKSSRINLLEPLRYDRPARCSNSDEDGFDDPSDYAVDHTDPREPIVNFESVTGSELSQLCDHFGSALVWATKNKHGAQPDLMQMGLRWLTIFSVMRPQLIGSMNLRLPPSMTAELSSNLNGRDPLETGTFFYLPLEWVRKCNSLLQLGKRAYSATYVLRGDLIHSATCAAIGFLDNKSRQAANKPIQEFRDTFGGIKSLPMRGKETRQRCKKAQEKN